MSDVTPRTPSAEELAWGLQGNSIEANPYGRNLGNMKGHYRAHWMHLKKGWRRGWYDGRAHWKQAQRQIRTLQRQLIATLEAKEGEAG